MARVVEVGVTKVVVAVLVVSALLGWGVGAISTWQRGALVAGMVMVLALLMMCTALHASGSAWQKLAPPALTLGAVPLAFVLWGAGGNWQIAVGVALAALLSGVGSGALEPKQRKQSMGPGAEQID